MFEKNSFLFNAPTTFFNNNATTGWNCANLTNGQSYQIASEIRKESEHCIFAIMRYISLYLLVTLYLLGRVARHWDARVTFDYSDRLGLLLPSPSSIRSTFSRILPFFGCPCAFLQVCIALVW